MIKSTIKNLYFLVWLALFVFGPTVLYAQSYPNNPVRLIVPQPPGGTTDTLARLLATELSLMWGVPVIVDNKGGAAQIIGTEIVAKAPSDGYTLGMVISTHAVNPSLRARMPYDAVEDFTPISLVAWVTDIVTLNSSLPPKNLKEFIEYVKENPGKLNYGSAGTGTSTHLAGEFFQQITGTKMQHVPFSGGAQANTALLGSHTSMMFANFTSMMPFVKAGKVNALAVTSSKRNPALPNLPTTAEAGLPGFEVSEWFGVVSPANTPKFIVEKISIDIKKILSNPDTRKKLLEQGIEPVGSSPGEFSALIKSEITKWSTVVKKSGITAE